MTFYQELQLNQAGSKAYIASFQNPKEKRKHIAIYLFKCILTVAFCVAFVACYCALFGSDNSMTGVVVLLCIMVFRFADLGIHTHHGVLGIFVVFGILAAGPKISNLVPVGWAFCINIICILLLMIIGCHNIIMFNHSTLVLSYLLLQGYDVSGSAYKRRLAGLLLGAVVTAFVFYRNHRKMSYKRSFKSLFSEFNLSSARTKWQLRFTFGISSALLIASLMNIPRAMWVGIAAMSVLVPFRTDLVYRVKYRAPGNILGSLIFLLLYFLLPESCHSYIGIIGGIGTGLSATYGWQTAFNSVGAIAVAVPIFGLPYAIFLRIFNNALGSIYAWLFDRIFEPFLSFIGDYIENAMVSYNISD